MKRLNHLTGLLLFLIGLAVTGDASAEGNTWWNEAWRYRTPITLNATSTGANILQPIGRAPVLVRLHSGNFKFSDAKADGADLRFLSSDNKTTLNFHIESFDPVAETAMIWVDIPEMPAAGKMNLYVYCGNADAKPVASSVATYDEQHLLVYHFEGQGSVTDATRFGNSSHDAALRDPNGLIGSALKLDGSTPLKIPSGRALNFAAGQAVTVSMWIKASPGTSGVLFDAPGLITLGLKAGIPYVYANSEKSIATGTSPISTEGWTHIVGSVAQTASLYINGSVVAQAPTAAGAFNGSAFVGGAVDGKQPAFSGSIDELEIISGSVTLGAIQLATRSQGSDAQLVVFGSPEQAAGASQGYMRILLHAVTPDGWVVISLLMVMAVISWWVMIGKISYVQSVQNANETFLESYRKITSVKSLKPESRAETTIAASGGPLSRLYQIGINELREISALQTKVSAESIALIRSSLDAGVVRESNRLNKQLVLLTIAISGGPFLGLLGTVIGVMITFAAIAAAGDVNINSIAPGIAAALVATVAGLGVAIPALFGYNYLTSRIEEISSEMQIFVDEFEKRAAVTHTL